MGNLYVAGRGDTVEGTIVHIDSDTILVDIGFKSEGILSINELPSSGYGSFNELHLNDKVLVLKREEGAADGVSQEVETKLQA